MPFDENGNWVDSGEGDLSTARPMPSDWPGGSYGWTIYERERLRGAGLPTGSQGRGLGEPAGRLGRVLQESLASTGRGRDIAEQLGRQPTALESIFGAGAAGGLPAPTPPAAPTVGVSPDWRQPTPSPQPTPLPDLSGLFANESDGGPGYTPSLVDTSAAEALLQYEETPEERAALEQLLQDLEFRAEAGIAAVRSGWEGVRAINQAAFNKAAQMARDAGPEAARLWADAVDNVRSLSAQAAEFLATTPGMQRVNISPTAGSERIAALLAAQIPRAQALAERMGLASAEEIAAQGRTAAMMGEAYAGDIQRTMLIQASQARQAHNANVLARVARQRELGAEMRFGAAQTNAQLLSSAAAAAAGSTGQTRRQRMLEFISDVERVATFENPAQGAALLANAYDIDPTTLAGLIESARQGLLDYKAAEAAIE